MRREVRERTKLGPFPSSRVAVKQHLQKLTDKYADLLTAIQKPVTDDEARALVALFGPDDYFGLVWPLVSLIESAPGWPLQDCLQSSKHEWIEMLKQRVENGKRRAARRK